MRVPLQPDGSPVAAASNPLYRMLCQVFLPHGYPDSVSADYTSYQIWDTVQAFCSTISGTLTTHAILRGVGVGSEAATPLSATATWVLKEGAGHCGKILFAWSRGSQLDIDSKKWRLRADVLNDVAMFVEIFVLPHFMEYATYVLCGTTTLKALVGVAGKRVCGVMKDTLLCESHHTPFLFHLAQVVRPGQRSPNTIPYAATWPTSRPKMPPRRRSSI